ncbi:putative sodium-coupled neutral amino acid transporter 10 [Dendronephthya gigantea]|uniref:putative sodium-coupled neutral amino acid transporter 10 n=1 Tax=Dendronephthya gigantea TaxID=151771 RepID=UPI00106BE1D9|nr:putative sodium-coupled neutral amino acid transporter 10 [Dendronephthya gigantea]
MSSSMPFVINLVNTAFGVTVLAVPYCFHQCGVVLGTILLVASSYASKKSCSLLLRSAELSRKRDFESLGFYIGGSLGKLIVEMSLIGYLVGTAIAWFVIIGDVSPAVVSSLLGIEKSWELRSFLIVAIGVCVVLPLSLVKDITSLSNASNVAIGIYTIFVLQLFLSTLPRILYGDWVGEVNIWKPDGVLQCLPIFGISFLCQTVVFVLYEALPEPSVKKMEHVVNTAMDIVFLLSFTVGFSGYVRYYDDGVEGDLLNNYKHDFISEFIRLGFCISTILSFPLLVFPCRSSINSLISSAMIDLAAPTGGTFIPHDRFFIITCSLIFGTIICGVLFPSVEFVMALVGATMGAMLTFILPAVIFLKISGKASSKTGAKILLIGGVCLLCLSTFSVLSMSESQAKEAKDKMAVADQHIAPLLHTPTLMTNITLAKATQELRKTPQISNKSLLPGRGHEEEKRNIIDEQKILVPQRNTAEIVEESRKEPVLPREGVAKQLQADDDAKNNPQQHAGIELRAGTKLQQDLVRTKSSSEDVGISRKPPGLSKDKPMDESQKLGRLSQQGDGKHLEGGLRRDKNTPLREKDRALNDEVRVARDRKILNDHTDSPSDVKTSAKSGNNVSVVDQGNSIVAEPNEKNSKTQNVKNNETNVDEKTERETEPTINNIDSKRKTTAKPFHINQSPLLRKQFELTKKILIMRNRRDERSDDRGT